ncbi:MAG: CPBP family intramembrane metalloprotease [Clostridia bacterium]|nr:CPBP family intramembrane metalloprotease [Clostridia bacterium]
MQKRPVTLIIGYLGALAGCSLVIWFNRHVLMSLPLTGRMLSMIVSYWLIAAVPLILMRHVRPEMLGFSGERPGLQCAIGIGGGMLVATLYILVPCCLGLGALVDNGCRYTRFWQFAFELVYCIVAVGAVEEIVFRGFLYLQIRDIFRSERMAILGSSVLFGFFHIFHGNAVQVLMTTLLGILFCLLRQKVKHCTLLSLILLHGVYDFMISLCSSLLFRPGQ